MCVYVYVYWCFHGLFARERVECEVEFDSSDCELVEDADSYAGDDSNMMCENNEVENESEPEWLEEDESPSEESPPEHVHSINQQQKRCRYTEASSVSSSDTGSSTSAKHGSSSSRVFDSENTPRWPWMVNLWAPLFLSARQTPVHQNR